jgi:hypothetical protein
MIPNYYNLREPEKLHLLRYFILNLKIQIGHLLQKVVLRKYISFAFFLSLETGLLLQVSLETHRSPHTSDQISELSISARRVDKNSMDAKQTQCSLLSENSGMTEF